MKMQVDREEFFKPMEIVRDVKKKIRDAREKREAIDYLTFVPDGEPTLDVNLGNEINLLKPFGIRRAVITNASLIWSRDIREELQRADWISLKIDAVTDDLWHQINRPYRSLRLKSILEGMRGFAEAYQSQLTTETMLIQGINDNDKEILRIADFLAELKPDKAYIAIPTRPPAEEWVKPPSEQTINRAYQIFSKILPDVEYLIGYEGNAFAFTGNVEEDLLSITSVHPMREEGVETYLSKANSGWNIIDELIKEDKMIKTKYQGRTFYMRKLPGKHESVNRGNAKKPVVKSSIKARKEKKRNGQ